MNMISYVYWSLERKEITINSSRDMINHKEANKRSASINKPCFIRCDTKIWENEWETTQRICMCVSSERRGLIMIDSCMPCCSYYFVSPCRISWWWIQGSRKAIAHFYSLISSVLFRTCNAIYMSCILYTSVKRNNSIMFLLLLRKLKAFGIVLMK